MCLYFQVNLLRIKANQFWFVSDLKMAGGPPEFSEEIRRLSFFFDNFKNSDEVRITVTKSGHVIQLFYAFFFFFFFHLPECLVPILI